MEAPPKDAPNRRARLAPAGCLACSFIAGRAGRSRLVALGAASKILYPAVDSA